MINELIEQIGGRAALQDLIDNPRMANCDETAFLSSALLAVLDAKPAYYIHRVEACDSYGPEVDLRVFIYELDASKCKDDHGGEVIEVFTVPPATSAPDALREAVNAIYFNDSSDYLSALWSVVRALSPETADLFAKDERAAFEMVNANIKHAAAPAPGGEQ